MGMTAFPEWVQSQKLVAELAERLGDTLNEASAQAVLALRLDGPTPERRGLLAILQSKARLYLSRQA